MKLDEWIDEHPELWMEFMTEAGEEFDRWVSPGREYDAPKQKRRDFAIYMTLRYAEEAGIDLTSEEETAKV